MPTKPGLLLDACCLLNICASDCLEAIAEAHGCAFLIAEVVSKEALYIRQGGVADDADDRKALDLAGLVNSGMLSIAVLNPAELTTFLTLASQVDDGEAATCALAIHRRLPLATDDRKARRLLQGRAAHLRLYSTLEMLKRWADHHQVDAATLAKTLTLVRDRGNFLPPKADPLRSWWQANIVTPEP
jgi:hypothetical protein